jgi:hypothetical protein
MGTAALERYAAPVNPQHQAWKVRPVPPAGRARVCGIYGEADRMNTVVKFGILPQLPAAKGRTMSRHRYQRPEVYLWTGKGGDKYWNAEWRQYIEGRPTPKHRSATWPCGRYTKSKAQEACDRLVREETGGTLRPDGSITMQEFWDQVYYPTVKLRIAPNTEAMYGSWWKNFIKPAIGSTELQHVHKAAVDGILNGMAAGGKSETTIGCVLSLIHGVFVEAVENGFGLSESSASCHYPPGETAQRNQIPFGGGGATDLRPTA